MTLGPPFRQAWAYVFRVNAVLREMASARESVAAGPALQAYLLGQVEYDRVLTLQRRLVYDVAGGEPPCLILCEHSPIVTVGRRGSRFHLRLEAQELRTRGWRVQWVNRGGGCWLQAPGQLAFYPILPLDRLGLTLGEYLGKLQEAILRVLRELEIPAGVRPGSPDLWVGGRPIACLGVAVRDWVTYFGSIINVNPLLEPFRSLRTGADHLPMTSLEREYRRPIHPSRVRERLLHHFVQVMGFSRVLLFSEHSLLSRKARADALAASY